MGSHAELKIRLDKSSPFLDFFQGWHLIEGRVGFNKVENLGIGCQGRDSGDLKIGPSACADKKLLQYPLPRDSDLEHLLC
jgi:hypothetical protein